MQAGVVLSTELEISIEKRKKVFFGKTKIIFLIFLKERKENHISLHRVTTVMNKPEKS